MQSCGTQIAKADKLKELDAILLKYNPSNQAVYCRDYKERCYFGTAPTLVSLRKLDDTADQQWLIPRLWNLSEFSGSSKKITKEQLRELAGVIAAEYYFLKVTELMVFFFQFKAGRYGKFYGNVDPMTITSALREFADERNVIYIKHEQELRDKQKAIDDAESRKNAITYEQWQVLKKQKEANGQIPDSAGKSGVR